MAYNTLLTILNNDIAVLNLIILCIILTKVWNTKCKCKYGCKTCGD